MIDPLANLKLSELRERTSVKWRMYPPDVLPVFVAEMDADLAPPVASALKVAVERGDTGYPHPGRLPEAFAGFAAERYGWRVDVGAPVLVADVMVGLVAALEAVTEPGDGVVISTPVYPPFFRTLRGMGRRIVSSPLAYDKAAGFSLDLDRLEADFAAGVSAYLLCNPHNPAGLAFSEGELLAIAGLADRYGVRVVCDEIHAPLTMPGVRHVPFGSLDADAAARSFTAVSASKAWNLAGLKAALLVPGPEAEVSGLDPELPDHAGLFGVLASVAAFEEGGVWLDGLRESLSRNGELVAGLMAERLPGVGFVAPRATYLSFLDFRDLGLGVDPAELLLERGRVALVSGPTFGVEGEGFARLNLATSGEILAEAVDRIVKAVS